MSKKKKKKKKKRKNRKIVHSLERLQIQYQSYFQEIQQVQIMGLLRIWKRMIIWKRMMSILQIPILILVILQVMYQKLLLPHPVQYQTQ